MVINTLRRFEVESYADLYARYARKELGVTEQRLPDGISFDSTETSDLEKIHSLLNKDTEWIYSIIIRDGIYEISVHEVMVRISVKTDLKVGDELLAYYGEDGLQKEIAHVEESNNSEDLFWEDATIDFQTSVYA